MKEKLPDLSHIRKKIDAVDEKIQSLIVQRGNLVQTVAEIKRATSENPVYYRPEREAIVLRNVMKRDCGPFSKEQMARFFKGIISTCLAIEKQLKVAYLGPSGSFNEIATIKHFGESVNRIPKNNLLEIFDAVKNQEVDLAIIPVENSIDGPILSTIECLINKPSIVCGELYFTIHQSFIRKFDSQDEVKIIYSNDQSFKQCRQWIKYHYPNAVLVTVDNYFQAAEKTAKDPRSAAISPAIVSDAYGLKVCAKNIEDRSDNTTHFFVIGSMNIPPSGQDKTAVLVFDNKLNRLPDEVRIKRIKVKNGREISLLEVDRHQQEESFQAIINSFTNYKILGSYPQSIY